MFLLAFQKHLMQCFYSMVSNNSDQRILRKMGFPAVVMAERPGCTTICNENQPTGKKHQPHPNIEETIAIGLTLQVSHPRKRVQILFKKCLGGDMLVPWRVPGFSLFPKYQVVSMTSLTLEHVLVPGHRTTGDHFDQDSNFPGKRANSCCGDKCHRQGGIWRKKTQQLLHAWFLGKTLQNEKAKSSNYILDFISTGPTVHWMFLKMLHAIIWMIWR